MKGTKSLDHSMSEKKSGKSISNENKAIPRIGNEWLSGKKFSALIFMLFFLCLPLNCALIANGTKQNLKLDSNPPGANVQAKSLNGKFEVAATTPSTIQVKRKFEYIVNFEKEGYESTKQQTTKKMNWDYFAYDLVSCLYYVGVIGLIIDPLTGAWYEVQPKDINVNLNPTPETLAKFKAEEERQRLEEEKRIADEQERQRLDEERRKAEEEQARPKISEANLCQYYFAKLASEAQIENQLKMMLMYGDNEHLPFRLVQAIDSAQESRDYANYLIKGESVNYTKLTGRSFNFYSQCPREVRRINEAREAWGLKPKP